MTEAEELEAWRSGMAAYFGIYTADPRYTLKKLSEQLDRSFTEAHNEAHEHGAGKCPYCDVDYLGRPIR